MKVLALDDERPALTVLKNAIQSAIPDSEIVTFGQPDDALEYISSNPVDAVFCDYIMPSMNGIEFGKRVKTVLPNADIVFVTGYDEYAINAVNTLSPQGYIVKPVSKSKIEAVLGNLHINEVKSGLYARTFGAFDVFFNGNPVEFKIKKSKELFAYLIDRGGTCTRRELTAVLYEDKDESNAVRYLTGAVKCLSETLDLLGFPNVFIRHFNSYSVDERLLSSDLYDYRKGNLNLFNGEYMIQYSWAEYKQESFR